MKLRLGMLLTAVVLLGPSAVLARSWTDLQGNTMEADFIRVHNGEIVLERGGRVMKFPFYQFSTQDQDFVRGQLEAEGKTHLIPEPPVVEAAPSMPESMPAVQQPAQPAQDAMQPAPSSTMGSYGAAPTTNSSSMMSGSSSPAPTNPSMGSYGPASTSSMDSMNSMNSMSSPTPQPYLPAPSSSMPDTSMPSSYSSPSYSPPSMPSMTPVYEKVCSNCNQVVPESSVAGGRCPHCNTYWDYDETTGKKAPGGRYGTLGGIGAVAVAVIGVLIKLFIRAQNS